MDQNGATFDPGFFETVLSLHFGALSILRPGTLKLRNQKSEVSAKQIKALEMWPVEVCRKSLGNVHKQKSITPKAAETAFAVRIRLWSLQPQPGSFGFCSIQTQFCMIRDLSKLFLGWLMKSWNDRNIFSALPFFNKALVIGLLHVIPCCQGQSADFGDSALLLHGALRISWTCGSFRCIVLHGRLLTVLAV